MEGFQIILTSRINPHCTIWFHITIISYQLIRVCIYIYTYYIDLHLYVICIYMTLPGRSYRFGNYCYITTYYPIVIRHGLEGDFTTNHV